MARKTDIPGRIVEAALSLAAAQGWRQTGMADIAGQAGLELAQVYQAVPGKAAVLTQFLQRIDQAMLADGAAEPEAEARDRLFEVVMRRFDALGPYKEGVAAILRGGVGDPLMLACSGLAYRRSLGWMLEAAGIGSSGPCGALRRAGLAAVMAGTVRVWLKDESEDMAATMAHLDKQLDRAEWLATRLLPGRRGAREEEPEAA
ncbi:MAG TPA: TetR family transcriptional regulator [Alphaproteobacteria bacterium]|jgi:AcrR family transcriptional regulator|nr:TetR family transcriptional regulator [Alphaproteobacteria bacterium]MDP6271772.1 TetR family transcriptional regulator [Alphaproteobacteria bacterium]MDP7164235.1 TetR family transcriptional regulator [Alphaproteobacteria bacterium]MDP7429373.1 TetR family transcriptional regulator [Alphaproteobacteria bacterium]HJM48503.1 TetR family transcriptional regulator [Alphaproteobacteria bacterium]|tara:strand:+ start:598 stop:1206 length:609 start_codon:yes stop_codon:yes gene_type:complete